MTKEYTETLTEVSEVLKYMDSEDVNKIPIGLLEFINQNKSTDYHFSLLKNKPFSEQNIKRETLAFLSFLSLNYWCENEKRKNYLYDIFKTNEQKYQEELREKYNPDNLFKNKTQTTMQQSQTMQDNVALIAVKENFFTKFIRKLKDIFHIKSV